MAYEKLNLKTGDEWSDEAIAHIEDGIATADSAASKSLTADSTLDMQKIGETTAHSRDVMRSDSAAKTREVIGAGTSSLTIGTTSDTAAAGDHKHSYDELTDTPTIPSVSGLVSQEDFDALAERVAAIESADGEASE